MKDVLTELSDVIYLIYIPNFGILGRRTAEFTFTIGQWYSIWEPSKMSPAEMQSMFLVNLSEYEVFRFWARIYSLKEAINDKDHCQLYKMLLKMTKNHEKWFTTREISDHEYFSWMFIMNQDGNLITTEGREIVKLLCEKKSDDQVMELMQKLIKGTHESWEETLFELERKQKGEGDIV